MVMETWSDALFMLELLAQSLVTGIFMGGVFALMSVGLGLIFGLMRMMNFAQPDFMMLGMYAAFYCILLIGGPAVAGPFLTPLIGAAAAAIAVALVGWLVHRFLMSRVIGTAGGGQDAQVIMTLGISMVLQNGALLLFGADTHTIRTPLSSQAWTLSFLFFNKGKVLAFLVSIVLTVGLSLFMTRTRTGKAMRAAADHPEAAVYMGISVARVHRLGFAIGIGLTAAAGGLIATYMPFHPYVGIDFLILMYAAVVLGGLGSISAAFWGGMTIGLLQQVSTVFLPIQLQNMVVFVAFLLIVLMRPQGLFGRVSERI
jgi:branched-chain amino acid transport system permease protein